MTWQEQPSDCQPRLALRSLPYSRDTGPPPVPSPCQAHSPLPSILNSPHQSGLRSNVRTSVATLISCPPLQSLIPSQLPSQLLAGSEISSCIFLFSLFPQMGALKKKKSNSSQMELFAHARARARTHTHTHTHTHTPNKPRLNFSANPSQECDL